MLGAVGMMDLAYVCEWERWARSTYCPSLPLACAWSCRNLIAFTTDLRNDDQGECPSPSPGHVGGLCRVLISDFHTRVTQFESLAMSEPGSLLGVRGFRETTILQL